MAEWFVGPIMEKLINTCSDYLQDQFRWQGGMEKELERLRENHPKIQAVVYAATQAQIIDQNPALNKWIWQLRDAIDEADDLLDEFEYMKHEEQLATQTEEETKVRLPQSLLFATACKLRRVGKRALKIDPNLKRLEEVVQKLDRISAEVSTFLHLIESTKQEQRELHVELHKTRETGSLPANDLIGRDEVKESIMQWLRKPSIEQHQTNVSTTTLYNNISLLSIVGHGGMGKTTLLQHVYEDDEITKEFDLKMWVCVSDKFDVKKVIGDMLESLKKNRPSLESLHALQESLKSVVISKKFLLVLDDIWEEDEERDKSKWEKVISPLAGGGLGSRILITTRMDSVACMIAKVIKKKKYALRMEGLQEVDCLELLSTHAFVDVENPGDYKKLRSIAKELVKKLSGSPLAAKVVGGVLNSSLEERHWRNVLNSTLVQNDIFLILKLSYIFLPKHLQNCFTFCSIFPQDYLFEKFDLFRMWIAVGFIQPSNIQEETLEDIGEKYFDVLVKKSFFDKVHITCYKMHDLLHELAQSVSKHECFGNVADEELLLRTPETIRHLSIKLNNLKVLTNVRRFKNLRTLRIIYDENYQDFVDTFNEIFKLTRSIRLLDLQVESKNKWPCMIPEAIGYLMHLRFLRYNFNVTLLPRSLSKLYHLQFIRCGSLTSDCASDDFFPRDMHNLSNLRYVHYPWLNFFGIGKLVCLQQLEQFSVKKEIGYRINELKHMNDLCILRINQLENVMDATDACNAKLCYKGKLIDLSLDWGGPLEVFDRLFCYRSVRQNIVNPDLDETVLDNLQPHNYLRKLHMNNYMGVRSAIWMNEAHLIENLEHIQLSNCLEWQILAPFGQLPFLKSLWLENMPKVKRLYNKFLGNDKYCDFLSLEKLHIFKLEALEDWFDARVDCLFPWLTELQLYDCPNLPELPYLPLKLEKLVIDKIWWKTLNCFSISKSIRLKTLCVRHCRNITFISLTGEMGTVANLEIMEIVDCPNLITLGEHQEVKTTKNCRLVIDQFTISDPTVLQMEPLRSVSSIRALTIENNDKLISFSFEVERWFLQVSSSLHHLVFRKLQSLKSLSSFLTSFSSLTSLEVKSLPQLQDLPDLPASVEILYLYRLKSLQCLPSSLSTISSLKHLELGSIQLLKSLPELPPSLCRLYLISLDNLECLPSCLLSLSSLTTLRINKVPLLRELPNLPPSLCRLYLERLDNLGCLPSCLPNLSSLTTLWVNNVPMLHELPNLPPSLKNLAIMECDPEFMKRYK